MEDKNAFIKILPFSGKEEDWSMWSQKFIAMAGIKGYIDVLEGSSEEYDATSAEARKRAYYDLLLSCSEHVSFNIVANCKNVKHPKGDARQAWEALVTKYEPSDGMSKVDLKKKFQNMKLEGNCDPDEWITKLEMVVTRRVGEPS